MKKMLLKVSGGKEGFEKLLSHALQMISKNTPSSDALKIRTELESGEMFNDSLNEHDFPSDAAISYKSERYICVLM